MSHHIFCNRHIVVDFAIVDLKLEADEVGQDRSCSSHCFDGLDWFTGLGSNNWKAGRGELIQWMDGGKRWVALDWTGLNAYGTM